MNYTSSINKERNQLTNLKQEMGDLNIRAQSIKSYNKIILLLYFLKPTRKIHYRHHIMPHELINYYIFMRISSKVQINIMKCCVYAGFAGVIVFSNKQIQCDILFLH